MKIMGINRQLSNKINKLLTLFPLVAIIGPRQCGKSTLVQQLRPDWAYYDMERPDDYQLITSDPLGFFSRHSSRVIIDEAQQYPDLFKILRGVIDQNRDREGRFILTGSSSPEIVKGLSESLAGRIATVELSPFKATEFFETSTPVLYDLLANESLEIDSLLSLNPSLTIEQMYDHWFNGGYPEPRIKSLKSPEFQSLWMNEYFSDYVRKDIGQLFPRVNSHNFRLFLRLLANYSGNIINFSDIARALEINAVTAKHYMDIIHNTFVWRNLRSFENNPLKTVQKMPKGFFRDQGILHHLLKIKSIDDLLLHPVAGRSFESFVIEEIIRGFNTRLITNIDYYFYRTKDKSEIDLIIEGNFGIIAVDIKLGHKINQRMLTSLKTFLADTKAPLGILVNNSTKIERLADNILQLPAIYL